MQRSRIQLVSMMLIALIGSSAGLAGCGEEEGPAEKAGKKMDKAGEQAQEKAQEAGEAMGEQIEKGGEKIQEGTEQ